MLGDCSMCGGLVKCQSALTVLLVCVESDSDEIPYKCLPAMDAMF